MTVLIPLENHGFCFENCERNQYLSGINFPIPNPKKTGTTICGIICQDSIILGADSRATSGTIIAEKDINKIKLLSNNISCCGAGTSGDFLRLTLMIKSQLELHRLLIGKTVPAITASRIIKQHLFRYQGHISTALLLGGFNNDTPVLYSIFPHGSISKYNYSALGSGSLAAIAVIESRWKPNMTIEEGKILVKDAILAGVYNDLASGNDINLCIIKKDGCQILKNYETVHKNIPKEKSYVFKRGSTAVHNRKIIPIKINSRTVRQLEAEPMDTL